MLVGLLGGKIANKFKLPNVSGYIIAGLFLGPSFFKLLNSTDIDSFGIINDVALALIAFGIGNEFLVSDMKKVGKDALVITVAEVLGALLMVFSVMYFIFRQDFIFSMVIASMSAATAPAGIVMVINELKADGPLVRTILPVVAFDDALGIMIFGIVLSIAKMSSGVADYTILQIIGSPLLEIGGAILVGFIVGVVMTYFCNNVRERGELLAITLAFILLGVGISSLIGVSTLLTAMVMGGTVVNSTYRYKRIFRSVDEFAPPVNLLFFTLAGASLDLKVLMTVGVIGVGYILARAIGKIVGAGIGARIVDAEEKVQKYIGMSLLTQGGISIGLSVLVRNQLPDIGNSIVTVILFSVLVFEILGPILIKIAITKAGEVGGMKKRS